MSSKPCPASEALRYWLPTASMSVASVPDSRIAAMISPASLTAPSTANEGANWPAMMA